MDFLMLIAPIFEVHKKPGSGTLRANIFLNCIYLKEEVQGGSQDHQEETEINAGREVESLTLPPLHYSVVKAVVDKVEDEDSLEMTGGSGGASGRRGRTETGPECTG